MADKNNSGRACAGNTAKAILIIGVALVAAAVIALVIYFSSASGEEDEDIRKNDNRKYFPELIADLGESIFAEDAEIGEVGTKELFDFFKVSESYYAEQTVTRMHTGGGETVRNIRILRDGDKYNVRLYSQNMLLVTVKSDGERVYIMDERTGESNVSAAKEQSMYSLAGLPDHENILSLVREFEEAEDKSTAELSECNYTLTRGREENVLTLRITYGGSGITEEYCYYLNSGVINRCVSSMPYGGGMFDYYKVSTEFFSSDISDYVFDDSFTNGG